MYLIHRVTPNGATQKDTWYVATRKQIPALLTELEKEKGCGMEELIASLCYQEINTKAVPTGVVEITRPLSEVVTLEYRLVAGTEDAPEQE